MNVTRNKQPDFWTMPEERKKEFRSLPACIGLEYAVPDGVTADMLSAAMDTYWDVLRICGDSDPNWGDIFGHVWAAMNAAKKSETEA